VLLVTIGQQIASTGSARAQPGIKPPDRATPGPEHLEEPVLLTIIGMIIIGAIAGFVARALVPGKDGMSVPATILLGIVGSFVGGLLASLIFGSGDGESFLQPSGLIGSVIGAIIALVIYNAVTGRKKGVRA